MAARVLPDRDRALAGVVAFLALLALAQGGPGQPAVEPARAAPQALEAAESEAARALREGRPLDVNLASMSDLTLLPRIGPALAGRIVASREAEGVFTSVDELSRVRGIGSRTVERLRSLVTVGAPSDGGPGESALPAGPLRSGKRPATRFGPPTGRGP